jgi:hypothetical protein
MGTEVLQAMTSPADIEHRLRERLRDFDDEVAEHLANETERADLWTEIDVPVSYLREAADTIAQLRDSNARDFRIAVERACDERMTEQKHEIRRLEAEAAALREALEEIIQWSKAYPLTVFPEPDLEKAHALLKAGGMTLDAISASNMRHVITQAGEIALRALSRAEP